MGLTKKREFMKGNQGLRMAILFSLAVWALILLII